MTFQPFHLVEKSPWPLTMSIASMSLMINFIYITHYNCYKYVIMTIMLSMLTTMQWWRDVCRESSFQGNHNTYVTMNMKYGMIMFIISEVFFFISFFWAYFHSMLTPNIEIGSSWPPMNMYMFDPFSIPLLNTSMLLSSGVTITWAHYSLLMKNYNKMMKTLILTIMLGIMFSLLQYIEYKQGKFSLSDSVYGSTFYMATGFHGLHVLIGTMFLSVMLIRMYLNHMSNKHHFGFEAGSWYWHFVDVVWMFLYIFIYWWP
nr:cytochrome c oxidase subunit 3 [Chiropterargas confusus]